MQFCHAQALRKATVRPYRGFLRLKKEGASDELSLYLISSTNSLELSS